MRGLNPDSVRKGLLGRGGYFCASPHRQIVEEEHSRKLELHVQRPCGLRAGFTWISQMLHSVETWGRGVEHGSKE